MDWFSVDFQDACVDQLVVSVIEIAGQNLDDDDDLLAFPGRFALYEISQQIVGRIFGQVISLG